jgi:hypothetical protein
MLIGKDAAGDDDDESLVVILGMNATGMSHMHSGGDDGKSGGSFKVSSWLR